MKIITALRNPEINEELAKTKENEILGKDIQYMEGVIEKLEKEKDVDVLIISDNLLGEINIYEFILKIKEYKLIDIFYFIDNKNEKLKSYLKENKINNIFLNEEISINKINNLLENNKNEIKKELINLKNIILENNKNNIKKINKINLLKNKLKNKLAEKEKIIKNKVVTVAGPSGVGKSIFCVLFSLINKTNNKILIIDFDILNNSINTILGTKKYPSKIRNKINERNEINNIKANELIIKLNKNIDLICGIELLFEEENKISFLKIKDMLEQLRQKYNLIIIDTSSECFLEYNKSIINYSDKVIFLAEANISELKKSKNLLKILIENWGIEKRKINIIFNKINKNSIDEKILKNIFSEFKILGKINFSNVYNLIINKNLKINLINKKIKKEYIKINKKIFYKKQRRIFYGWNFIRKRN